MVKQAAMVNVLFEVLNYSTLFTVNGTVSAAYPGNDSANSLVFISKPLIGMDLLRRTGTSASVRQKAHSLVGRIEAEDQKHTIPQPILMTEEGSDV